MLGVFNDLSGQRFGALTVVKRAEDYISPKGLHKVQWLCKCDCGNEVIIMATSLSKGRAKSCGCFRREVTSKKSKKYNTYDLSNEYGIGYTSNGEEFYFDLEDYNKIKDYCWATDKDGYIVAHTLDGTGRKIRFHRLVYLGADLIDHIDHINHKVWDNRKHNLRPATVSQNNMNKILSSNNTSGVTGVGWHKTKGKWRAYIVVNKKQIHLGDYNNFKDAVKARKDAEEKYFGEFSYDNSLKQKEKAVYGNIKV